MLVAVVAVVAAAVVIDTGSSAASLNGVAGVC
jgi:hypothetical protein